MPKAKIWNQNPFNFHLRVGELEGAVLWLRFRFFIFSPAPFCGPYGNECAGFLLLSVIALLYFVSGRKTDANQQAASQIRQKQVSPFCPACPGYPAIPLPTRFHPYFLLAYRTYLQSVCRDEWCCQWACVSRMYFDSILLLTCYSSSDICFSFHLDGVACLLLGRESALDSDRDSRGQSRGMEMDFGWHLISLLLRLNDYYSRLEEEIAG